MAVLYGVVPVEVLGPYGVSDRRVRSIWNSRGSVHVFSVGVGEAVTKSVALANIRLLR